ncbi:hypothetical protein [Uliginosibacterium sp. H1]|uniref:hypothetical protein n=1 Tax=Uliginosibacterium sp. H1 TaxID=3114757 RepID=UPI002E1905D7|nr:hypothetical protein [Uliginosibacterium sp. H1]
MGWLMLCVFGLLSSPFVGFAIHGKVAVPGLAIGMWVAVLPLLGLVAIATSRWAAWRRLPPHIAEEWRAGRLIPAEGAPAFDPPVRFSRGKDWIEMRVEGVLVARHTLLSVQGVPDSLAVLWIADATGEMFIPWNDVAEWIVDTDSDGPDHHVLHLHAGGRIRLRRFSPDHAGEGDLLDAVRSVGGLPIRLRCEVD